MAACGLTAVRPIFPVASLSPFLPNFTLPLPAPHPLCTAADEVTVGKVYAALMIFDFYKQSKTSRDQTHQAPGGLTQVPAPGFPQGAPVPSAARRPWEPTPLPRRFGGKGRRQGPAAPRLRPHAPRCFPSACRPVVLGSRGVGEPPRRGARVPGRERGGLSTAPGDAMFLSGGALGGGCLAGVRKLLALDTGRGQGGCAYGPRSRSSHPRPWPGWFGAYHPSKATPSHTARLSVAVWGSV